MRKINDLLQRPEKGQGHNLRILRDDPQKGAVVEGLHEHIVKSPEEVLDIIEQGEKHRHYGETNMNVRSSRSHTIFRLILESRLSDEKRKARQQELKEFELAEQGRGGGGGQWRNVDGTEEEEGELAKISMLNLVDLAGSERQNKTGARGERLREGAYVNKSLSTLALVVSKLVESHAKHKGGRAGSVASSRTGSRDGNGSDSDDDTFPRSRTASDAGDTHDRALDVETDFSDSGDESAPLSPVGGGGAGGLRRTSTSAALTPTARLGRRGSDVPFPSSKCFSLEAYFSFFS